MRTPQPIITLQEWTRRHEGEVSQSAANKWANTGRIAAYRSGHIWLVRATLRPPTPRSGAAAAVRPLIPSYVTLREWTARHSTDDRPRFEDTVQSWIISGEITDAYQSGSIWLIRADLPVPPKPPEGAAAHRCRYAPQSPRRPRARAATRPATPPQHVVNFG